MEGFHHQPSGAIAIPSSQQTLPAVPPALPRKQLPLVAAVQQGPGLGPQPIDQVIQIDAPGPRAVAAAAVDPPQLTHPRGAQVDDQPVVVQFHAHLLADQGRRHRIDHLPHLDRAGAPHPHQQKLVVSKAEGRQRLQVLQLLLVAPQPGAVEALEHPRHQFAVLGGVVEIKAAA
jgi:hypothetical protein